MSSHAQPEGQPQAPDSNPPATSTDPSYLPVNTDPANEPSAILPGTTQDPITCHVLDLTSGLPAPSLSATLTLLRPLGPSAPFTAVTNSDGRIMNWNAPPGPALSEIFENLREHDGGKMIWALKFQTEEYYAGNTFFPEVEVKFICGNQRDGEKNHWHVPLLLGPWSYTTYRGS